VSPQPSSVNLSDMSLSFTYAAVRPVPCCLSEHRQCGLWVTDDIVLLPLPLCRSEIRRMLIGRELFKEYT
jgi:hypothetical protein